MHVYLHRVKKCLKYINAKWKDIEQLIYCKIRFYERYKNVCKVGYFMRGSLLDTRFTSHAGHPAFLLNATASTAFSPPLEDRLGQSIIHVRKKGLLLVLIFLSLLQRGWTTWLTGAVDRRVVAIVPIVMDLLNISEVLSLCFVFLFQYLKLRWQVLKNLLGIER